MTRAKLYRAGAWCWLLAAVALAALLTWGG